MEDFKTKEMVYISYLLFCRENKLKAKPEDVFYKEIHFYKPEYEMTEHYLKGFKLKNQQEIFKEMLKLQDSPKDVPLSSDDFFLFLGKLKEKLKQELNV